MMNRSTISISLFAIALVSTSISIFSPSVTTVVVDAFSASSPATFASSPSKPMLPIPTTNHHHAANSNHEPSSNHHHRAIRTKSNTILFSQIETNDDGISEQKAAKRQSHRILNKRRKQWINRSLKYYTTVAREQKRRSRGQLPPSFPRSSPDELQTQIRQAEHLYFARNLIKSGKLDKAEALYRRIIDEIQNDEDGCDHARLAVSTLLLALLKQRMDDVKGARSVFLNFFRTVLTEYPEDKECACSAKVLQAYALFEMKRGHGRKSLEIVERAVELDEELRPVLAWKQFQEVMATGAAGQMA